MSTITTIERLKHHVGETVTLRGWLYDKSSKGKLHFAKLRDGTGFVQCVLFKSDVPEKLFEDVGHAGQESSLRLTGLVKAEPRAPGGFEIAVSAGEGSVTVEARRDGVSCKGRVKIRAGSIGDVQMQSAYSAFP